MKKALIVGINDYGPQHPRLTAPEGEAVRWRDLLTRQFAFAANDVRMLLGPRATKPAILERLAWLMMNATPQDKLVFVFLGHGVRLNRRIGDVVNETADEALVACPIAGADVEQYSVYDDELESLFELARVPLTTDLTMILDCCYAGGVTVMENDTGVDSKAAADAAAAAAARDDGDRVSVDAKGGRYRTAVAVAEPLLEFATLTEKVNRTGSMLRQILDDGGVLMRANVPADIEHRSLAATGGTRRFGDIGGIVPMEEEPVVLAAAGALDVTIEVPDASGTRTLFSKLLLDTLRGDQSLTYREIIAAAQAGSTEFAISPVLNGPANRLGNRFPD